MMMRRQLLVGLGAAAVGAVAVGTGFAQNILPRAPKRGPRADYFPNVKLYTHEGKAVRFYDDVLAGRVMAMNVMYATCDGICPVATETLKKVHGALGKYVGRDVFMYSLSLLPEDTPEVLRDYMEMHEVVAPGWTFLTGSREDVTRARRSLGFYDIEPAADSDKSRHSGMVRIGNETLDRWSMEPVVAKPKTIARSIMRMIPGGTRLIPALA